MLVYKDIINGAELFSDSYPIKLVDDTYYEVEGKVIKESCDIDDALIGGNKAAEAGEEDEGVDSSAVTGINVVLTHKLTQTAFGDKKEFVTWLKDYVKTLKEKLKLAEKLSPEELKDWQSRLEGLAKKIVKEFDNWYFYMGDSEIPGMVVIQGYREDNTTPYFIFFKDGLEMEKY